MGFKKWIVVFENLRSDELFSCEMMRLFPRKPEDQGVFLPIKTYIKDYSFFLKGSPLVNTKSGILSVNLPNADCISVFSEKGFLPGEKITLRTKNLRSDNYDTLEFYPRPIALYDSNGEELACSELFSLSPATYIVHFAYNPKNRLVRINSTSGNEHFNQLLFQEDQFVMYYNPDVLGDNGGFSSLRCTYQNGDTYELTFPWGEEFFPYMIGSK